MGMKMELTRKQREIVGRGAMLLFFGLLPIWGGIKCVRTARWLDADFDRQHVNRAPVGNETSGAGLPYTLGAILLLVGGIFTLASVLPSSTFERLIGPPGKTSLWENPEAPEPVRTGWGFWGWW